MPYSPERVPEDILSPIFEQLSDQRDLLACSLVSWTFNRAVTPILYRSWDTRVVLDIPAPGTRQVMTPRVVHPVKTLLAKRDLLQYVRHARARPGLLHVHGTELFEESLTALRLCAHLQTFTWTDDQADRSTRQPHKDPAYYDLADQSLRDLLKVLQELSISELTIRTYSGLTEEAWSEMRKLTGLRKVALWCMEGQPRVLQGWSEVLGNTLTHLVLGRCQGVPPTILHSVLSQLPLLQSLGLKGAPSSSIPEMLTFLPNLTSLDVDYSSGGVLPTGDPLVARLEHLKVHTNDLSRPRGIWGWIIQLVPYASLKTFKLNAFSVLRDGTLPRRFILDLAGVHKTTLKHFQITGVALALQDIQCLCAMFPNLEVLTWSVMFTHDITEIGAAVANGKNLRALQVDTDWVSATVSDYSLRTKFNINDAREMMLREGSKLRKIYVSGISYTGKWIPVPQSDGPTKVEFEILRDESTGYNWL